MKVKVKIKVKRTNSVRRNIICVQDISFLLKNTKKDKVEQKEKKYKERIGKKTEGSELELQRKTTTNVSLVKNQKYEAFPNLSFNRKYV